MNEPDGIWNMGESPAGPDQGGVLDRDATAHQLPQPTFVPLLPGGWAQMQWPHTAVQHYVGSFRNQVVPPHPDDDLRASFEVVAPFTIEPGMKVVVAIFTQASFGGENPQFPHVYPGDPNYHDLYVTGGVGPHIEAVERNQARSPAPPYRVVGVQFVPRWSNRPIASTLQRLRQVRYAVEYLLGQPPYGIASADIAYHVGCSSFGAYTAQLAPIYYPQEFHSATASAYSGAHRSMPSDFDSHVFSTALLGQDYSAHSYTMRDTLDIPIWCRTEETDFASASFTNRWYYRTGSGVVSHIQRPVYFVLGDEDTVTHGTDWVAVLNQGTYQQGQQREHGELTIQSTTGVNATVRWSVVSKSGHGEPRTNEFTLRSTPTKQTNNLDDVTDLMIEEAYGQIVLNPTIQPITHGQLGRKLPTQTHLPSLDPNREALSRRSVELRQHAQVSRPNLLTEVSSFRDNHGGQGTWLGAAESLKIARIPGEPRDSVFVGSADGFVTRLMMVPTGTPTIRPLVEQERSKREFGSVTRPYSLGHATWGLAVGDVDPDHAGDEVVVGSYNRIALFHAADLKWIREVTLPSWEYDNPRKMQVADLLDAAGNEIVFRTLHGHLVIMDRFLTIQHEHGEGGIVDFIVGPTVNGPGPWIRRPLYLLSARGHVVRLEIDPNRSLPALDQGVLAAASHLEYGVMRDLDLVTRQNQQVLAALFLPHVGTTDAVRYFSLSDCSKVGQFGDLMHDPPQPPPPPAIPLPQMAAKHVNPSGDMEPSLAYVPGHGADRYVISGGGEVSVWDGSEIVLGHKDLGRFAPSRGHGCIEAGEIDETSPGHEVVVATTAGRVVWFKLSELTTPGEDLGLSRTIQEQNGIVYEDRCNTSLTATWAMQAVPAASGPGKLRVVDAGGTIWEVDPNGKPTFVVGDLPARALLDSGATSLFQATGGTGAKAWDTTVPGYLVTTPYVPEDSPGMNWWLPTGLKRPLVPLIPLAGASAHWLAIFGGATFVDASTQQVWCATWQMSVPKPAAPTSPYFHFVQRYRYTLAGGAAHIQDVWASTLNAFGVDPPPRFPPSDPNYVKPVRSELGAVAPMNMDAIGIGRVLADGDPHVVVSGMGGRVMVLDGSTGRVVRESADFGLGGMALAIANLDDQGPDEILFAPIYDPIVPDAQFVRSTLRVFTDGGGSVLNLQQSVPVGEPGNADFPGYGTCGIAVVDLSAYPLDLGKVVIVTTLNGELLVFDVQGGAISATPLFKTTVEGSIGAFGSIVVADLDPADPLPELYVAGSLGIRRFDFHAPE